MATKVKKLTDELQAPTLPGTVDNNAVKTAAAGVQNARNAVTNMTYDNFKSGDLYKGLQRDYQQQGQQAMKDTLGQVAARTGGMASSYATSAANQSYNNYMQALEEAARNMYNDEYARKRDDYNMALREYDTAYDEYRDQVGDAWDRYDAERGAYENDRDHNYKVERDERLDADKATTQAQEDVMAIWESGGTAPMWLLKKAGWTSKTKSSDGTISTVVNSVGNAYKAQATNSAKEEAQADAYDEIYARIANGETLKDIADSYKQGGEVMDWKGLTGISEAEWQQIYNENEVDGYTYPKTEEGANGIVNALMRNGKLELSDKDQNNFDYIYGEGAYDAVGTFIADVQKLPANASESDVDNIFDGVAGLFDEETMERLIKKANPDLYDKLFYQTPENPQLRSRELNGNLIR